MRQKLAELVDLLYGWRKFLAFAAIFIAGILLRVMGYINGDNVTSLLNVCFASFCTGNIAEHFTTAVKSYVADRNVTKALKTAEEGIKDTPPEDN